MFAKDFKAIAKERLAGNWGTALAATLLATLCGAFGYGTYGIGSSSGGQGEPAYSEMFGYRFGPLQLGYTPVGRFVLWAAVSIGSVLAVWSVVRFLLGGSVELGYRRYTLKLIDGFDAQLSDVFSMIRSMFTKGFLLQLLMDIYTLLWAMLFVVPGIIKALSYSMAPFIMAEHPEMTPKQCIAASKELMTGNKWRLFCLDFSFIGWELLGAFTFGILYLWLNPYMQVSTAAFYRQIVYEKYGQQI